MEIEWKSIFKYDIPTASENEKYMQYNLFVQQVLTDVNY